jgi:hypothetical protein
VRYFFLTYRSGVLSVKVWDACFLVIFCQIVGSGMEKQKAAALERAAGDDKTCLLA